MKIRRINGISQPKITRKGDLQSLPGLNEAYWMITSAPADAFSCDPKFLRILDRDGNRRIRTDDVKDAVSWMYTALKPETDTISGTDGVYLRDFRRDTELGENLFSAAAKLAKETGPEPPEEETGAGSDDPGVFVELSRVTGEIEKRETQFAATLEHRGGGTPGFEKAILDSYGLTSLAPGDVERFTAEAEEYLAWKRQEPVVSERSTLSGDYIYKIYKSVQPLMEDFFFACASLEFGVPPSIPRTAPPSGVEEGNGESLRDSLRARLSRRLVAEPNIDREITLTEGINPLYAEIIERLRSDVLPPVLDLPEGPVSLGEEDWKKVAGALQEYRQWKDREPETAVARLPENDLEDWLASGTPRELKELLEDKENLKSSWSGLYDLEKCLLYGKWLFSFANNFAALRDLGSRTERCMFEAGHIVLDGRQLNLCLHIEDVASHKRLSAAGGLFLIYCRIEDADPDRSFLIVSPVTAGESGYIYPGKRGVFFDLNGREWDAVVIDVLENPISLGEILKRPFRALGGVFERQMKKSQQARSGALLAHAEKGMTERGEPASAAGAPASRTGLRDLILAGGIGLAALGSSFAFITSSLSKIRPVIALAVVGA